MLTSQSQVRLSSSLQAASRVAGVVVAGIGGLVLIGWASGLRVLVSLLPGLVAMKANSAIGFLLAGVALWWLNLAESDSNRRSVARACAGMVVVVGVLTLSQDLFGWNLGIDQLLFREISEEDNVLAPGRMGQTTALGFVFVGLSLRLIDTRGGQSWSQSLALVTGLFGLLGLAGYVYSVEPLYRLASYSQMALHTAIAFILLCFGILSARPERGLMSVMASHSTGGTVARRLLPAAILVPLFVGWLRLLGEQAGWYGTEFGVALFALSNMIVFAGLVLRSARLLHRADTNRQSAEDAVRESRNMLALVMDNIPQGVFWKDRDSKYLGCNRVVCDAMGLHSQADTIGKTDREFPSFSREQAESFIRKDREVMDSGQPEGPFVETLTRADGSTIWLETIKLPLRDAGGRVIGVLGNWQDITKRRQAEEAIANYNERLRILHQIDRALIAGEELTTIAATALSPLRELLGVPRAIVNLFDLEKGEVEWLAAAGRRRVHVGPGVRYSIRFMGDVAALRRGEQQMIDVHALPPGPEVDALLKSGVHTYAVVPMIAGGELIGAISFGGMPGSFSAEQIRIAQEVATQFAIALTQARLHERVKLHAQELEVRVGERTQELEAANKELEAFSYSVSHDLRAPLRAIDGFSRILLMEHVANMPTEVQDYLRDIRANTQQMGRLVDDLLAFSRLSRQPLKKQRVDLTDLVRQCLDELLRHQPEGRQVELRMSELPACWADPMLLKQVWINLLSNALKYSSKRDVTVIEIGSRDGDAAGRQTYFINGNGVGFDMRYVHKLFNVFQRLHRAEEYEGTGVGLAIVQRVVHRHGGRVWAESVLDQGATFSFTLENQEAAS